MSPSSHEGLMTDEAATDSWSCRKHSSPMSPILYRSLCYYWASSQCIVDALSQPRRHCYVAPPMSPPLPGHVSFALSMPMELMRDCDRHSTATHAAPKQAPTKQPSQLSLKNRAKGTRDLPRPSRFHARSALDARNPPCHASHHRNLYFSSGKKGDKKKKCAVALQVLCISIVIGANAVLQPVL